MRATVLLLLSVVCASAIADETPRVIASREPLAAFLADDGDWLYWTRPKALVRAPRAGGRVEIVWKAPSFIYAAVVRGGAAYAIVKRTPDGMDAGTLERVTFAPRATARAFPDGNSRDPKLALVVSDRSIFWVTVGGRAHGTLLRAPVSGGAPELLRSEDDRFPQALALDGETLLFAEFRKIFRQPEHGTAELLPIVVDGGVYQLKVAGDALVWEGSLISRPRTTIVIATAPRAGGEVRVLAESPSHWNGFAVDGGFVYVADGDARTLARIPLAGGAATILAHDAGVPSSPVIAGGALHWLSRRDDGTADVLALPLPAR